MRLKKFDFNIKDNRKKKSIIVTLIIVLVLLVGIGIYATFAAYKVTKTYNVIQGKVSTFTSPDISIIVKKIDAKGKETVVNDFPSKDEYSYLAVKSKCDNGSTIEFDSINWQATITSSVKDNCAIYFDAKALANTILANNTLIEEEPDFSTAATDENTNIYQAMDDYGTSYYFRGATTNNYVKFGEYSDQDMYWRIIRINGDGTIRMIYDGTTLKNNGISDSSTGLGGRYHAAEVRDDYYNNGTYHTNYTQGRIASMYVSIDDFYLNNLKTHKDYIADSSFCNDRSPSDTVSNWFAGHDRIYTNEEPILTCSRDEDVLTVENGGLYYPIGLITADEAMMAGAIYQTNNTKYYLYRGFKNYTMTAWSPGHVAYINVGGNIYASDDNRNANGAGRPVINLKANVSFIGDGSIDEPYEIIYN